MSTVDKAFADNVAKHGGWFNGDSDNSMGDNPRVILIIEYDNAWGGKGYGLCFDDGRPNRYTASEFVRSPRVYWSAGAA